MSKVVSRLIFAALPVLVACTGCGSPAGADGPVGNSKMSFQEAVQKAGGDYTKLSPEDQKKADAASRGHGVQYVKNIYGNHP